MGLKETKFFTNTANAVHSEWGHPVIFSIFVHRKFIHTFPSLYETSFLLINFLDSGNVVENIQYEDIVSKNIYNQFKCMVLNYFYFTVI